MIEFFLPMIPPTITYQEHKIAIINGKPKFFRPPSLAAAREKLQAHLAKHAPPKPLSGAVMLGVKWCFPIKGDHEDGEYKTSKPDTDNLNKMLKDVMEELGFWKNDAQVASEHIEKFWADIPGIYVITYEMKSESGGEKKKDR